MTGPRPRVAGRLSLDDAARIGGILGPVRGATPCPHCGRPLRTLMGTSGDATVSLLSCTGCGVTVVLETHAPPRAAS